MASRVRVIDLPNRNLKVRWQLLTQNVTIGLTLVW